MNKLILSIVATVVIATGLVVYENAVLNCRKNGECYNEMSGCKSMETDCHTMKSDKMQDSHCGEMEAEMYEGEKKCCMEGQMMHEESEEMHSETEGDMPDCHSKMIIEKEVVIDGKCCKTGGSGCKDEMKAGKCCKMDEAKCKEMMMSGKCCKTGGSGCNDEMKAGKCCKNEEKAHHGMKIEGKFGIDGNHEMKKPGKCGMEM